MTIVTETYIATPMPHFADGQPVSLSTFKYRELGYTAVVQTALTREILFEFNDYIENQLNGRVENLGYTLTKNVTAIKANPWYPSEMLNPRNATTLLVNAYRIISTSEHVGYYLDADLPMVRTRGDDPDAFDAINLLDSIKLFHAPLHNMTALRRAINAA